MFGTTDTPELPDSPHISQFYSTPSFLELRSTAEIPFKTLKLHFPEDFAPFVDVVAWREVGAQSPGLSLPFRWSPRRP